LLLFHVYFIFAILLLLFYAKVVRITDNILTTSTVLVEAMGDFHVMTSADMSLHPDAFDWSDEEKIERIAFLFR